MPPNSSAEIAKRCFKLNIHVHYNVLDQHWAGSLVIRALRIGAKERSNILGPLRWAPFYQDYAGEARCDWLAKKQTRTLWLLLDFLLLYFFTTKLERIYSTEEQHDEMTSCHTSMVGKRFLNNFTSVSLSGSLHAVILVFNFLSLDLLLTWCFCLMVQVETTCESDAHET